MASEWGADPFDGFDEGILAQGIEMTDRAGTLVSNSGTHRRAGRNLTGIAAKRRLSWLGTRGGAIDLIVVTASGHDSPLIAGVMEGQPASALRTSTASSMTGRPVRASV